jgi:hypothetical protein
LGHPPEVLALTQGNDDQVLIGDPSGMHTSSYFNQLLQAAMAQPHPQRLLFVFATAELPEGATPAQRRRFAAGGGGSLAPLMCVDKAPGEVSSFDALAAESREAGPPWQVMFAAGLSGTDGNPPTPDQVDRALQTMAERIRSGMVEGLAALDPSGNVLSLV